MKFRVSFSYPSFSLPSLEIFVPSVLNFIAPNRKSKLLFDAELDYFRVSNGLYRAGDYLLNGSVQAAITSGEKAALALIEDIGKSQI